MDNEQKPKRRYYGGGWNKSTPRKPFMETSTPLTVMVQRKYYNQAMEAVREAIKPYRTKFKSKY